MRNGKCNIGIASAEASRQTIFAALLLRALGSVAQPESKGI